MSVSHTIAELFRSGAAPDAEETVYLKDIGSFAATLIARYADRSGPRVGARTDAMVAGLATQALPAGADAWLDSLRAGAFMADAFWTGLGEVGQWQAGYHDLDAQRDILQLMEDEGLPPAEANEIVASRGRKASRPTGLVGRRPAAPAPARRAPAAAPSTPRSSSHAVLGGGQRMATATLKSLVEGGLPLVDQVQRLEDAGGRSMTAAPASVAGPGAASNRAPQRSPQFSIDGLAVDARLPALASSLAAIARSQQAPVAGAPAAADRMGLQAVSLARPQSPSTAALFDADAGRFLGLDAALAAEKASDGAPSRWIGQGAAAAPRDAWRAFDAAENIFLKPDAPDAAVATVGADSATGAVQSRVRSGGRAPRGFSGAARTDISLGAIVPPRGLATASPGRAPIGHVATAVAHRADGAPVPRAQRSLVGGEARFVQGAAGFTRMLNPGAAVSGRVGASAILGGMPSAVDAGPGAGRAMGGGAVGGAPTASFPSTSGTRALGATAAGTPAVGTPAVGTPEIGTPFMAALGAGVRRPSLPLGAGFSGYETFAVQQLATRGLGSDGLVAQSFAPIVSGLSDRAASPAVGASAGALRAWASDAVDGAVWLSLTPDAPAPGGAEAASGPLGRRMGLGAAPEPATATRIPAKRAASIAASRGVETVSARTGESVAARRAENADVGAGARIARTLAASFTPAALAAVASSGALSARPTSDIVRPAAAASAVPAGAFEGVVRMTPERQAAQLRQALLRPVPTAREVLSAQAALGGEPRSGANASSQGLFASMPPAIGTRVAATAAAMSEPMLSRRLTARFDGVAAAGGPVTREVVASQHAEALAAGAPVAVREMMMRGGWRAAELDLLLQDAAGTPASGVSDVSATSVVRQDRLGRNLARVSSGKVASGGPVSEAVAGAGAANAAARQQAAAYLGLLAGRAPDAYFGAAAPAGGLGERAQAASAAGVLPRELSELVAMASGDARRADSPLPLSVRREVVAALATAQRDAARVGATRRVRTGGAVAAGAADTAGVPYAVPPAFEAAGLTGQRLAFAEVESGLVASGLSAASRGKLLAELRALPNIEVDGVPASIVTSLIARHGGADASMASGQGVFGLQSLVDRGLVMSSLAERFDRGELLTVAEVEAAIPESALPAATRQQLLTELASRSAAGRLEARSISTAFASAMARAGDSIEGSPSMLAARAGAPVGVVGPATGLRALADRGLLPSSLADRSVDGELLTMTDVERIVGETSLGEAARGRVLAAVRANLGSAGQSPSGSADQSLSRNAAQSFSARAVASTLASELGVLAVSSARPVGAVRGAPIAALADRMDTRVPAQDVALGGAGGGPDGGLLALAERGLVPMALADRAMLGDLVSMAEVEAELTARSIPVEVRRRALESVRKAAQPGAAAVATAARTPAAALRDVAGSSAGWAEARVERLLAGGVDASQPGFSAEAASLLSRVVSARGQLDLGSPELELLTSEPTAPAGVGGRVAEALSMSAAGPAGAARVIGAAARTARAADKRDAPAAEKSVGFVGEPIEAGARRGRDRVAARGFAAKGWTPAASARSEELLRNLPVALDKVLAPEVMLSGMRSLEVASVVREMSIRGAGAFESTGVLTTLADSGVDLGAGRSALSSVGGTESAQVERLLARAQRSGGSAAANALSEILLKGADPVAAVGRARFSRRERAGLLSSILKGTERAETASIFESAGAADFAFEWLSRVDGSKSGVDVGVGEARAATARTFGGRRDSAVAERSPLAEANLVAPTSRGGDAGLGGVAAHARPVAQALVAGKASRADAIRRTDWRLVDTGVSGSTSHADLGKLASALVGNKGSATASVPMALVAPAAKSVAQTALRSDKTQARASAPKPAHDASANKQAGPGDFSLDPAALDMLALEMAGLVAELLKRDDERVGRWT